MWPHPANIAYSVLLSGLVFAGFAHQPRGADQQNCDEDHISEQITQRRGDIGGDHCFGNAQQKRTDDCARKTAQAANHRADKSLVCKKAAQRGINRIFGAQQSAGHTGQTAGNEENGKSTRLLFYL